MLKDLFAQAQYVPRALLLTALITAAGLFCMDGGREKWMIGNIVKYRRVILFVFYLSFLLTCAVFARGRTYPLSSGSAGCVMSASLTSGAAATCRATAGLWTATAILIRCRT